MMNNLLLRRWAPVGGVVVALGAVAVVFALNRPSPAPARPEAPKADVRRRPVAQLRGPP
jgi:hypothetical protein